MLRLLLLQQRRALDIILIIVSGWAHWGNVERIHRALVDHDEDDADEDGKDDDPMNAVLVRM